jgi:hypothetical protein
MAWYRRLSDRRGRLRFELVGDLPAVLGTSEPLSVRDVSLGGATVEAAVPLPVDSAQSVCLASGDAAIPLAARVRSVHRSDRPDGAECYRIGLEFTDLSASSREAIARLADGDLNAATDS